jgi:hypothetical protein
MKLLIAIAVIAFATINAVPIDDDDHFNTVHGHGPYASVKLAAANQATNRRFGGDSPTNQRCVAQCIREMQRQMPNTAQQSNQAVPSMNKEALVQICRAHNSTKSCLDRCGDGETKRAAMTGLGITQHICQDSTFMQHVDCYKQLEGQMNQNCDGGSGRCAESKRKMEQATQSRLTTPEEVTDMTKHLCVYTKCSMDCTKPLITERCGEQAWRDFEGVYKKLIETFKFIFETTGLGHLLANECKRI